MAGSAFVAPPQKSPATAEEQALWDALRGLVGAANGETAFQRLWALTGVDDDTSYVLTVQNQGTGGHITVPGIMDVTSSGVVIGVLSLTTLTVSGAATFNGNVTLGNAAGDAITVTGTPTFAQTATFNGTLAANGASLLLGAVTLGDAAGDGVMVNGTMTVAEILTLAKGLVVDTNTLVVDAVNNRVGILQSTPTAPLTVNGRIQVTAATAPSAGAGLEIGYSAGGIIVSFDRTGGTYQTLSIDASTTTIAASGVSRITANAAGVTAAGTLTSTGGITLSGPNNIDGNGGTAGQLRIGAVIVNQAALTGAYKLEITGDFLFTGNGLITGGVQVNGGVTVVAGPLTVPASDPPTSNADVTAGGQCKAFAYVTAGGGATLGQNYNVFSVTRNGAGDFTVTIDRDFSAADYAVVATVQDNAANLIWRVNGQAAGSFDIHFRDTAGVLTDPDGFAVACFGTLT